MAGRGARGAVSALGGFSRALSEIAKIQMMQGQAKELIDYKAQAEERLLYARHANDKEMARLKADMDKNAAEILAAAQLDSLEKTIESSERVAALKMKQTALEGEANRAADMFRVNAQVVIALADLDKSDAERMFKREKLDVERWSAKMGFTFAEMDRWDKLRSSTNIPMSDSGKAWLEGVMERIGLAGDEKESYLLRDLPIEIEAQRKMGDPVAARVAQDWLSETVDRPWEDVYRVGKKRSELLVTGEKPEEEKESFFDWVKKASHPKGHVERFARIAPFYNLVDDYKKTYRMFFPRREGTAMLQTPDWSEPTTGTGEGLGGPRARKIGAHLDIEQPEFPETKAVPGLEHIFGMRKMLIPPRPTARTSEPDNAKSRRRLEALEAISREPAAKGALDEFDKAIEEILRKRKKD